MGVGVEKAAMVEIGTQVVEEVVQRIKNCHFASAHRSYKESSSFAPWTVFAATTATYLSYAAHTAPCTSSRPP